MDSASFLIVIYWTWLLVAFAAHFALSLIVFQDAKTLSQPALGISPFLWFSISLILPVGGMFIYWLMNHSSLKKDTFRF